MLIILILLGTQALFTLGDFLARANMGPLGFHLTTFLRPWFLAYFIIRQIATFGQLYIFTQTSLGKTAALFSVASIIMSNILGYIFLQEILSPAAYIAIMLAITAILILTLK